MADFNAIFCSRGPAKLTGKAAQQGGKQSDLFGQPRSSYQPIGISVTAESGGLKVNTPFNRNFVDSLKTEIPATGRKWDSRTKCWYVARQYADDLKRLIDESYGCNVTMPTVIADAIETREYSFLAEYIGNSKDGVSSVYCSGGWNAKIPEKALRAWFKQVDASAPATFYGVLGISEKASGEEIKKAYKRCARQWHPDICREPEAREMFEKVKEAYDVLSNPATRTKYNAGLMFEKMAKMGPRQYGYRRMGSNYLGTSKSVTFVPLLRCGKIVAKAKLELGMLIVEEIISWDDVQDEHGRIMTSFWAGDNFSVMWV